MRKVLAIAFLTVLISATSVSAQSGPQTEDQNIEITEEYNLKLGFLEKEITAKNNGESTEIVSDAEVPRFFSPAIDYSEKPGNQNPKLLSKKVEWTDELDQGEQKTYTVSFAYWRVLMVLFFAGIAGYGVRKHRHHQLLSKSKEERGDNARIDIDIYNSGKRIQDVTVEEFIPSSLEIEEITTGNPEIEGTENGQEIIWDLEDLKEGDQRVLSYKIRSKEDITAVFTLPASVMKTAGRKITESNRVEVQLDPSDGDPT